MMRLSTILKSSRGKFCGQVLRQSSAAKDIYGLNTANFSTIAQKDCTGGSSTVGQKTYTGGNASFSRSEQKGFTGDRVYAAYNVYKGKDALSAESVAPPIAQKAYTGGSDGSSTVGQKTYTGDRVYAAYIVYKGKAALSAEPVAPTFGKMEAGGVFIKRPGYIMLSISPSKGERKYDWERKQRFALSATEVGSLISMGPTGSCEFFHDPGMLTSNAGQVRKTLQIRGIPDGNGYFISLSVVDNVKKINERFAVPVTAAEFAVMRTSFNFVLPHIMGWDRYTSQSPASASKGVNIGKVGGQQFDSEWDR